MKLNYVPPAGFHPIGRGHMLDEKVHDTYKLSHKLPEPSVCPGCGAVFTRGGWRWGEAPSDAHQETCPACHRIADHYPAGYVLLQGGILSAKRAEVLKLIRAQESREKAEHALQRIMDIQEQGDRWEVTTTDIHLARRIGEALHGAYHGELELHYNPQENLLRVNWAC